MTTYAAQDNTSAFMVAFTTEGVASSIPAQEQGFPSSGGGSDAIFKMRGRDAGRPAGSNYIVWTSTPTADFAGAGYAGGSPTPIGAMVAGSVVQTAILKE